MVLGPQRGYELAEEQNLAATFVVEQPDGKLQEVSTKAFTEIATESD